ncbi:MAG: hypothetical protein KDH17_07085 [Rhodocyclaceae bacterium]|nr:hypothetical protein [Rhodocyclaceae bacterium]
MRYAACLLILQLLEVPALMPRKLAVGLCGAYRIADPILAAAQRHRLPFGQVASDDAAIDSPLLMSAALVNGGSGGAGRGDRARGHQKCSTEVSPGDHGWDPSKMSLADLRQIRSLMQGAAWSAP